MWSLACLQLEGRGRPTWADRRPHGAPWTGYDSRVTAVTQFVEAIIQDQYAWGEFGRSEEISEHPRTADMASAKPNFWVSSQAAFALVAISGPEHPAVKRFERWVAEERAHDGWWTTQTGAISPRGGARPSTVHNLRHTAKGLDLLVCQGKFSAKDVPILEALLNAGDSDGSWPGYHNGDAELWSTAYVVNLIARLLHENITWLGIEQVTLRSRLDGGLNWLVERRRHGIWTVDGQDPIFTTEAVLAEIGALLAEHRPDVCNEVARELLANIADARRPTAVWALAISWRALEPELQTQVVEHAAVVASEGPSGDVLDRACAARLALLEGDVAIAAWYADLAGGHESALPRWQQWDSSEYHNWCLRRAVSDHGPILALEGPPCNRAEAWHAACALIERWGAHVEQRWRGLWNGDEHVDEAKLQASFETFAQGAGVLDRAVFAEVDTGRGPVDFIFVNGLSATVYVEFKRGDHARLAHGAEVQLPTYMRAAGTDAGLLVCVSFEDADSEACAELAGAVKTSDTGKFIRVIAVDARQKPSASKA